MVALPAARPIADRLVGVGSLAVSGEPAYRRMTSGTVYAGLMRAFGLTAEGSASGYLFFAVIGIVLVVASRAIGRLAGGHPSVSNTASGTLTKLVTAVMLLFGFAFLLVGGAGFVTAITD